MLRFSTKKLLLNRRWLIVALIAILVAAVTGYSATQNVDRLEEGSNLLTLLVLSFLMPVLALLYGASMIRNEIDDRSITTVITSPLDRRVSYIGYFLALILVLGLMMLLLNVVGWSSFFLVAGVDAEAVDLLLGYSLILLIGGVVYASLFLALGVALKQPIYLGLIYVFVWEGFVGSAPGAIGEYTIGHQLGVIAAEVIGHGEISRLTGDPLISAMALLAVTVASLILGAMVLHEKELP
jgi:ABC-2 type transport system permease protein